MFDTEVVEKNKTNFMPNILFYISFTVFETIKHKGANMPE
jgi:hypothetical protein